MSFKLKLDPAYWWPVNNPQPVDGQWIDQVFDAQFVRMEPEAFEAFMGEVRAQRLLDSQVVPRIVTDWRKVVDEKGQPIPFTSDMLAAMCRLPGAASNIVKAWMESQSRIVEKN